MNVIETITNPDDMEQRIYDIGLILAAIGGATAIWFASINETQTAFAFAVAAVGMLTTGFLLAKLYAAVNTDENRETEGGAV